MCPEVTGAKTASEVTTPAAEKAAEKAAKKNGKKTPAKKNSKKAPAKKAEKVNRTMAEVPASQRKTILVKLMRKMGATSSTKARTVEEMSGKLGYTKFDVYGLLAGTSGKAGSNPNCLLATGFASAADAPDGARGVGYYLTAKGVKTAFDCPPFARKAAAENEKK